MAATAPRRRKMIGHRRRIEDEGEDDAGQEGLEIEDDSMSDGSLGSDDDDQANDSDTSNVDEASPTSPLAPKGSGNGAVKAGSRHAQQANSAAQKSSPIKTAMPATSDTDLMMNGLSIADKAGQEEAVEFEEADASPTKSSAPVIVSSSSAQATQEPLVERRRREHEEYRKKRDEDPAFVPNRGAFFMHDHRHAGPAGNGFRPFGRLSRGGRGGRGGFGGLYAPMSHLQQPIDPTASAPWVHDMHEAVASPAHPRASPRNGYKAGAEGPANGDGYIPTRPEHNSPINRILSSQKHIGNVQPRVWLPFMEGPRTCPSMAVVQYTKLPDHRPPLRRDKPVRISLPDRSPRYIFPASDRSFIFIPRALRPNQQRVRGKPRSGLGSVSGFSRRTSIYGGSVFGSQYGSYTPSLALSRRSSLAPDVGRDFASPAASTISRAALPMPMDIAMSPVVRLPPMTVPNVPPPFPVASIAPASMAMPFEAAQPVEPTPITDVPPPVQHPLPQKPTFQENRSESLPMHQPTPRKAVSVETIESPNNAMNIPQPYQQAFHQQVPPQMSNGYVQDVHNRNPSYAGGVSTGTPLSQIPERAIHAAPFQPTAFVPQGFYGQQYPVMQAQPGYYYPQPYGAPVAPSATAPSFVPAAQQPQQANYAQPAAGQTAPAASAEAAAGQSMVPHEVNGMVYYYDPSHMPPVADYTAYPPQPGYSQDVNGGMPGMMPPGSDGYYYQQAAPAMAYYPQ